MIPLLLIGCVRVPSDAGFPEVQRTVAERAGHRVHWNRGSAEDEAVTTEVRAMLDRPLTPEAAVAVTLLHNRRLQATYESLMIAQADLVQAGLLNNPIFDAEVRFQDGDVGIDLGVLADFLHVLQVPLRKRIAAAGFQAAKLGVAAAVIERANDARDAAVRLISAEQLLEMRRTILAATRLSYELARRLHDAGNITDLSLAIERAQHESAKLEVASAEADVVSRRERLNMLMGLWGADASRWTVIDRLPDPPAAEEARAEGLVNLAVERSLALEASRYRVMSLAGRVGLTRGYGLLGGGEVEAGVVAEREAEEGAWAVGPAFSLPIPLFDQGQARLAAAAAELRRERAAYFATAVEVRAATRAAYARLQNARGRVTYYQQVILPLRQEIVDGTQLQYNAMQVGAFALLQVRAQQVEAGEQYIQALREYWLARGSLDTMLAGGGADMQTMEGEMNLGGSSMGSMQRDDAGDDH